MEFIFAGGGTGGHLFPGLAVAELLSRRFPGSGIRFIGSRRKLESDILLRAGYDLVSIPAVPFSKAPWRWPGFALRSLGAYVQSARIVGALDVDLVVALGGYAAYWPARAAGARDVPVIVLEQNMIPGKANRRIARWAYATCVQFAGSAEHFGKGANVVVTGNPVRERLVDLSRRDGRRRLRIPDRAKVLLIVGGSQGARAINELVVGALRELSGIDDLFVIHQTGTTDYQRLRSAYQAVGLRGLVRPFFHDFPCALAAADLVIGRAGATGIAEICARGLPSILIPFPHAADDHQRANARELASRGAAVLVEEREITGAEFFLEINNLLGDPDRMRKMGEAAGVLDVRDAAARVVELCVEAIEAGRGDGKT